MDDWFDVSFTQPVEALALVNLLGATIDNASSKRTTALLGTDQLGQDVTPETHPVGVSFGALLPERSITSTWATAGWSAKRISPAATRSATRRPGIRRLLVRPAACRTVGESRNLKCDGRGTRAVPLRRQQGVSVSRPRP